jgi:hypothetical protein
MANWGDLGDNIFAASNVIREKDMRALRDAMPAIAEGAAGAPKISGKAVVRALPVTATLSSSGFLCRSNVWPLGSLTAISSSYTVNRFFGVVRLIGFTTNTPQNTIIKKNGVVIASGNTQAQLDLLVTVGIGDVLEAEPYGFELYCDDPVRITSTVLYGVEV